MKMTIPLGITWKTRTREILNFITYLIKTYYYGSKCKKVKCFNPIRRSLYRVVQIKYYWRQWILLLSIVISVNHPMRRV